MKTNTDVVFTWIQAVWKLVIVIAVDNLQLLYFIRVYNLILGFLSSLLTLDSYKAY